MEKWFSFGDYVCCLNGSNELIKMIPDRWNKFEQRHASSFRMVTVNLEEKMEERFADLSSGWEAHNDQIIPLIAYIHKGKAVFSLRCVSPYNVTVYLRKALSSYLRIGVQYGVTCALYQECIGMHGVTLLCGDEMILLSAPSGTGKTTLANLLEKYCDSVVINGDFALLVPTEHGVIFEPTPFCGTSGRSLNHRVKLNRVVFLGQAKENRWRKLDWRESLSRFMSNAFIPDWDKDMLQAVQENILKCMSMVNVNAYDFAPTQEAAELFLKKIEEGSYHCSG